MIKTSKSPKEMGQNVPDLWPDQDCLQSIAEFNVNEMYYFVQFHVVKNKVLLEYSYPDVESVKIVKN